MANETGWTIEKLADVEKFMEYVEDIVENGSCHFQTLGCDLADMPTEEWCGLCSLKSIWPLTIPNQRGIERL